MNRPLTLGSLLLTLSICVLVAALPVGYAWTIFTSKLENIETKTDKLHNDMENIGVCQKAKAEAFTNQSRIGELENQLEGAAEVLQACKEQLQSP